MQTAHFTATATAAKIADAGNTERKTTVIVKNTDAANTVYIGNASVTSANGLSIAKGTEEKFEITNDDDLYAVCAASLTATIEVLTETLPQ